MTDLSNTDKTNLVSFINVRRTQLAAAAGVTLSDTMELNLTVFR